MSVSRQIRDYSRHHEWVGNIFSLVAVVLIFGTIWASLSYYPAIASWLGHNPVLHGALLAGALALEVLLILVLLSIGSTRAGEEDERSFATFSGRRNSGSPLSFFRSWLHHMENVGKKHR